MPVWKEGRVHTEFLRRRRLYSDLSLGIFLSVEGKHVGSVCTGL